MARPLRIEYSGACYHVINRGDRREEIFLADKDCELFLEKLTEYVDLYNVIVYSYCLMPNHFHLQLKTPDANLGKFMQSFLTSFTLAMNKRYNKSGHLFQGRYKAQLVENDVYKNELSRYIHLNPIKVKTFEDTSLHTIKNRLYEYKWSSLRSYIGLEKRAQWLDVHDVLCGWGKTIFEKMLNYKKFVEDGITTNNADKIKGLVITNIIGSDTFSDNIVKKYLVHNLSEIDEREQSALAKVNTLSTQDVLSAVAAYFNIDSIEKISHRLCYARKLAMFLAGKYCRRKESLTSIAKQFGLKISGFNTARYNFEIRLKSDKTLLGAVNDLENIIKNIKT